MDKEKIDFEGMVRLIIKETNKLDDKQEKLMQNFKPDYTVTAREGREDQWYLEIGEEGRYRVGYIFLRDLFLVYDKNGKMILELKPKEK